MKLYVWRKVLTIVGDGIIAVIASSEKEARKAVVEAMENESDRYGASWLEKEIENVSPKIYDAPKVVWCVGSE